MIRLRNNLRLTSIVKLSYSALQAFIKFHHFVSVILIPTIVCDWSGNTLVRQSNHCIMAFLKFDLLGFGCFYADK